MIISYFKIYFSVVLINLSADRLPKIILNGLKIMSIEFEKIKLIDSHNFISMPFSKFPKTFGFYEMHEIFDSYPDVDFYGPKFMNVSDRQIFLEWHAAQNCKSFNFNEELYKYCLSDVEIL